MLFDEIIIYSQYWLNVYACKQAASQPPSPKLNTKTTKKKIRID